MKTLLASLLVCAWMPDQLTDEQLESVLGVYLYHVPADNLQAPPTWFQFVTGSEGCIEVQDSFAAEHCFVGQTVSSTDGAGELSSPVCHESACHQQP